MLSLYYDADQGVLLYLLYLLVATCCYFTVNEECEKD